MSTHAIGPVRLLFGSLLLLFAGAAIFWFLVGRSAGNEVLVIRGGALEIEPWAEDLRVAGSDVWWDQAVTGVQLSIAKAQGDDDEYVIADPIAVQGVRSIHIDVRIANSRTVEDALVLVIQDAAVKMTLKEGQLARRGDVWVPPGFVQNGQAKRYEIAKIEFLDRADRLITRYQNPDMGRHFRFRVKLTASKGIGK